MENPGISGKSGNFENVGKFRIWENFFRNFRNLKRRNFSENFVFFIKPLCAAVHNIKISVKLVEIRFFEKNPKMSQDLGKSKFREKCGFSGFSGRRKDTAYF
jgi:hypothetical protein